MRPKNIIIVIPARYQSSRFPGKPLQVVAGKSMIERVWSIASAVDNISEVIVATDDDRILNHVNSFGGKVVLTDPKLTNGTERVQAVVKTLSQLPDVVINFQGDSVLTPPWILNDLVAVFDQEPSTQMATLAYCLNDVETKKTVLEKQAGDLAGVLVVFDKNNNALYFSRSLIPRNRSADFEQYKLYRHIGIYAYTPAMLEKYVTLPISILEQAEQLEQLRALENGIKIKVALSDYRGRTPGSIDTPEDLIKIEELIKLEGELL